MSAILNTVFRLCEEGRVVQESILVNARAELAQLRADADELREARSEAGAMDGVRLAALIHEENDTRDFLRATVAGQAQQLKDSTELIRRIWEMADNETSTVEIDNTSLMWQIEADTRAWLAANPAPAQQEDDERIDRQLNNSGWETDELAESE